MPDGRDGQPADADASAADPVIAQPELDRH